ncbi:hypothetical protein Rhe02_54890 [Rhizocola hellebori]|uniref:Uncharacterized protein n=1 Tax=Rhizocola hellebori TaxID=1392758 RepID=A0A8J3VII0_9ACTN|nr:hypothetical protein [Rhizocola hellebori]GIH07422.1 hypothetical protein Rhe02_54890 [Rhizocola hellebori]
MALDLELIMTNLDARLQTVTGLNSTPEVPTQGTPPFAFVGVPLIPNYHLTMNKARVELRPTITLLVGKGTNRSGQFQLARYANPAGEYSIQAAIEGDRTLGGACEECVVESFRPLGSEEMGVLGYFGGQFTLLVVARGN